MTANGWLQIGVFLLAIFAVTPLLGGFMARVFSRQKTWLDPVARPLERLIYKLTGVDEAREMRWTEYAVAVLMFSVVSMLVLYVMQRLQHVLPLNPQGFGPVAPDLAFNTAVSFTTNTNWQAYGGETTMSYFTQMAGLAYHNFVSAAVGISVAIAFIRGIAQREKDTLGNFWVDMVRATLWVLLPISIVGALFLVSQGVVQNLKPYDKVAVVDPQTVSSTGADGKPQTTVVSEQTIAQGPVASQEIIKQFGTNGGGFFNANSSHPFENPTPLTNFLAMFGIFAISAGLTYTLGSMTGSRRHGWAVWGAMAFLFVAGVTVAYWAEARGNPMLTAAGADQVVSDQSSGGNMEGKEVRFGIANTALFATSHDRRQLRRHQRLARLVHAARRPGAARQHAVERGRVRRRRRRNVRHPRLHHPLGLHRRADGRPDAGVPRQEDSGVRSADGDVDGADLLVRHPDVHRARHRSRRTSARRASSTPARTACRRCSTPTRPPAANNGSAFGGITVNTKWYNTTLGLAMLFGRFFMIIPPLAIAGSLSRKKIVPGLARHVPGDDATLRRVARRRHRDRRRPDVLSGPQSWTNCRAFHDAGRTGVLMATQTRSIWDPQIVQRAVWDALRKLHPRTMARNPVMFVVLVGSVLTTLRLVQDIVTGGGDLCSNCRSRSGSG